MEVITEDQIPDKKALLEAAERVAPHIHRTPVLTCKSLNELVGAELYFKCENFQKIGAFKIRGATNAILSMSPEQQQRGFCTHSSGNHAQAVARAARSVGAKAYIVMPTSAPEVKKRAVAGYGAEITFCEPTLAARESTAAAVLERTGANFLHPFDDFAISAGQSTAAQEFIQDVSDLDILMAPVGGGGLLAGTALAARHFSPGTKVVAGEPAGADDCYRSFRDKTHYPSENPKTIADGLLTSVGKRNFMVVLRDVADVVTCSEDSIVAAMRMIWERMKIIVEPSSAVPLACILEEKVAHEGKKVGIIISGGNVDLGKLPF